MAKARVPKDVGGVAIPIEMRRLGNKLIARVDSRLGREALAAGMTLAAAAVIAAGGLSDDDRGSGDDAPDAPEPPTPPVPPTPPTPPVPPTPPAPPRPPFAATAQVSPAQAQAVADALGNVAQAALTRFLSSKRGY